MRLSSTDCRMLRRLAPREDVGAILVDADLLGVDPVVGAYDVIGEFGVALVECRQGVADLALGEPTHRQRARAQAFEFLIVAMEDVAAKIHAVGDHGVQCRAG